MPETQCTLPTYNINDILPPETLGSIFEEHARLEWRAPAINGQVCRLWRQITLNSPRVWTYLEVNNGARPSMGKLRSWLCRSGAAPLHIRVHHDFTFDEHINMTPLHDLLSGYHMRISSLRVAEGQLSFFDRRAFPCMRHLVVDNWAWPGTYSPSFQWGLMPQLQSLQLAVVDFSIAPLEGGFSLKTLSLAGVNCISLPQHSQSLTTLMLSNISLKGIITGPVVFPLLTYLSLLSVIGLKSYVSAPCLTTYHEGGCVLQDNFPTPIQSLVEYGVYCHKRIGLYPTRLNYDFPNLSRLSIWSQPLVLISLLECLADDPQLLPTLQKISIKERDTKLTGDDKELMYRLVRARREASHMDTRLYFETAQPFQIPIFFRNCNLST